MLRSILFVILLLAAAVQNASAIVKKKVVEDSTTSVIDGSCIASVSDSGNQSLGSDDVRLTIPTSSDVHIQISKNLTSFFVSRLKAITIDGSGGLCNNPLGANCIVSEYTNASEIAAAKDTTADDAAANSKTKTNKATQAQQDAQDKYKADLTVALTNRAIAIYDYAIYPMLYQYIQKSVLDGGTLDAARSNIVGDDAEMAFDMRPFDVKIKEAIASADDTDTFVSLSSDDVNGIIEVISDKVTDAIMSDVLFAQADGVSSLVNFPITSRLMECLSGTFRNLLMRDANATIGRTPFAIAQDYFKPAVFLALILYFIAYGYKIVMAHGMGKQSEIIMFGIKFALVFYFAIGDAWKDFAFDMLQSIPATVAQIVFSSMLDSGDRCAVFTPDMYPQGKGILAFFDMIDCKYANYIGLPSGTYIPSIFSAIAFPLLTPVPIIGMLWSSFALIYLGQVTYGILIGVEIYISSILFFIFYIFLSPLIVPMALFSKTEDICKKYQTKIISTVVQSLMAVVMLVVIIGLMDVILYGSAPQSSQHQMFIPPKRLVVNGVPQVSKLNTACYPGGAQVLGFASEVVPITCILARMADSSWMPTWLSFPIPYLVEFFSLPNPLFFLSKMTSFIVPCVYAVIMLLVLQTITSQIASVVEKISGATSIGMFGASKFNAMGKAVAAGGAAKDEGMEAGKMAWNAMKGGGGDAEINVTPPSSNEETNK